MELPTELNNLIQILLKIDTSKLIDDLAKSLLYAATHSVGIPSNVFTQLRDNKFQVVGITLLAVEDAKTQENPSSANPLYNAVFARAKELIQE